MIVENIVALYGKAEINNGRIISVSYTHLDVYKRQDHAYANGYTVVREIGGHGIGLEFHEEPWVGYNSKAGTEMLMVPGMVFTIEPMVNMGQADIFVDEENDWTVYTADGQPSAQWEVMVLVTEDGYEILSY